MPAEVRPDMLNVPPTLVMKRALPPVLVPVKRVVAPLLVVTVEVPAVAELLNARSLRLTTFAAPAVLLSLKLQKPFALLMRFALLVPPEAEPVNETVPLLTMVAEPAVAVLLS